MQSISKYDVFYDSFRCRCLETNTKYGKKHTTSHVKNWMGYAEGLATFLQRGFLYDDWNKDSLQVMMAHNQVLQNAISTRVGSLNCITIYSPRLENFMCHRIYSKWRENWNEKAQASTYH